MTETALPRSSRKRPIVSSALPYKGDCTRLYNAYAPSSDENVSRFASPDVPPLDAADLANFIAQADDHHSQGDGHNAFDVDKTLLFREDLDSECEIRAYARTIRFLVAEHEVEMAENFWDHLAFDSLAIDSPKTRTEAMLREVVKIADDLVKFYRGAIQELK